MKTRMLCVDNAMYTKSIMVEQQTRTFSHWKGRQKITSQGNARKKNLEKSCSGSKKVNYKHQTTIEKLKDLP